MEKLHVMFESLCLEVDYDESVSLSLSDSGDTAMLCVMFESLCSGVDYHN